MNPESFDRLMQLLPIFLQVKIKKFRNWQDAERSLVGNILLIRGLHSMGLTNYSLHDLQYTAFQKPYLDDLISFNITHSGNYVVCAVSKTNLVGVDVEEIKDILIDEFNNLFAKVEWDEIIKSENKMFAFYTLWTKKEAFLKVIGCGLSQPLNGVIIENNKIKWEDIQWFLHEIKIDSRHICYLCCDDDNPFVVTEEVYLI